MLLDQVALDAGADVEAEPAGEEPVPVKDGGNRNGRVAAEVGAEVELEAVDVGEEALVGEFSAEGGTGTHADTEGVAVLGVGRSGQGNEGDEGNEDFLHVVEFLRFNG